ncbi:MAG TPA: hypothetical protein VHN39_11210 [Phenylobacterium sp.]|jgi:hypothetical protein|nr:hypothetical protein [Phenylobacterium sp.]
MASVGAIMRRRVAAGLAICALALSGLARARPGPDDANTVSELVVTALRSVSELLVTAPVKCIRSPTAPSGKWESRPKIVSTFPAKGDVVRPGLLIVRVTFDQKMVCDGGFDESPPLKYPTGPDPPHMLLSYDRQTIRTICYVGPNGHYGGVINPRTPYGPFKNLAGVPAEEYAFDFTTSTGPPIKTACDALMEDAATAHDIVDRGKHYCGPPKDE